jgi:hypothetical protein
MPDPNWELVTAIGTAIGGLGAAISAFASYVAVRQAQLIGRSEDKRRYAEQIASLLVDCCEMIRQARGRIIDLDFSLPPEFRNISDNAIVQKIKLAQFSAHLLTTAHAHSKFAKLRELRFIAKIYLSEQIFSYIESVYELRSQIVVASRSLARLEANQIAEPDFNVDKFQKLVFGNTTDEASTSLDAYEAAAMSFVR